MSKEQIEEMKKDLCECHTIDEWAAREYGEAYTDFDATAEKMLDRGWSKQSEGEWRLIQTEGFGDGSYYSKFFCSLCYREIGVCHEHEKDKYKNAKALYPYCHCGAKMKGGAE